MAHITSVIGAISEMVAAKSIMEGLGYEVSRPIVPEVYDLVARDPVNNEYIRIQVKTLRIREDRNNALVVYARKRDGKPYTPEETDYIIGVNGSRAFMFECTGLTEYWSTEQSAKTRWVELSAVKKDEAEAV